jgi:hypothetical protein
MPLAPFCQRGNAFLLAADATPKPVSVSMIVLCELFVV